MANTSISLTDMFKRLHAPLANARWSWGSVRKEDGVIVLRVWQDKGRRIDGVMCTQVLHPERRHSDDDQGYNERQGHVELIRRGAKCYLIMCQAEDVNASPRKVRDFEEENVFAAGKLQEQDNGWWIELGRRVPTNEAAIIETPRGDGPAAAAS